MRVLTFLNSLGLGGIEITLLRCMPYLVAHGIQMDICCTGGPAELDSDFEAFGCKIFRIGKYVNVFRTARSIEYILKREDHTLIHSRYGYISGGACLAGKRIGIPVIVSFHDSTFTTLLAWQSRPVIKTMLSLWLKWHVTYVRRFTDIFVGHSEANLESFSPSWRLSPSRYRVIRNCIEMPPYTISRQDSRRRLGLREAQIVALHVGSFQTKKNHVGLLEIFQYVLAKEPDAVLIMVGDGKLKSAIEKCAAKLGLRDSVRFEGHQLDPWLYYSAADVFIFPSITEGYGNVLIEAQASGLAVVASDIPPHREALSRHLHHDSLFPPGLYDKAAELVWRQLEKSVEQNNRLNEARTYTIGRHSCARMADELVALYSSAVSDGARSSSD